MIPTQFICVPTRIYPSLKTGCFWAALHLPCTALQKTDRQPKGCKRRFPWKWGMKVENQAKLKEKEPKINDFWLWVAEREGFEPSCAWAQTDFESAPLWPLRYLSVFDCFWILHGFCKADGEMLSSKIQEKWSICEEIEEYASFRKLQSDKHGYLSSQPRYDLFDTDPYLIMEHYLKSCSRWEQWFRCHHSCQGNSYDLFDTAPYWISGEHCSTCNIIAHFKEDFKGFCKKTWENLVLYYFFNYRLSNSVIQVKRFACFC